MRTQDRDITVAGYANLFIFIYIMPVTESHGYFLKLLNEKQKKSHCYNKKCTDLNTFLLHPVACYAVQNCLRLNPKTLD